METAVANNSLRALRLAQDGRRDEAEALLSGRCLTGEEMLVRGYLLLPITPDSARDLLARARRVLTGDLAHLAAVYEARAYEYVGQVSEGRILINAVLREPLNQETLAQALLVKAVFDADYPTRALAILDRVPLKGLRPSLKGRIHNQRARMFGELRNFDNALIEYAGAASFFRAAGDQQGVAHALNNQAGVERKLRQFENAHRSVDKAIALVSPDDPFVANFFDHKAQILIDEAKYEEAETWALKAVSLVKDSEYVACYVEAICTLARAVAGGGDPETAERRLREASVLARNLDSNELLFKVQSARKDIAERFVKSAEVELVELALKLCNGCVRAAAKKLDMTHTGITKLMKRNNRIWKPKKPTPLKFSRLTTSGKR